MRTWPPSGVFDRNDDDGDGERPPGDVAVAPTRYRWSKSYSPGPPRWLRGGAERARPVPRVLNEARPDLTVSLNDEPMDWPIGSFFPRLGAAFCRSYCPGSPKWSVWWSVRGTFDAKLEESRGSGLPMTRCFGTS